MPVNNYGLCGPTGRCAQPDQLGFEALRDLGYTHIIKLNTEEESPTATEAHAFQPGVIISMPNLSPMSPNVETLRGIIQEIIRLEQAGQKVLVHCTHGRDRTGMVCAGLRIIRDKWPLEGALMEFSLFGTTPWPIAGRAYRNAIKELVAKVGQ